MSIVRVVKNQQYTVIHNSPLQDQRLSLKARGLLAFCFSLPDNWQYSIEGLVKAIGRDGRDAVRVALKELETCGYLKRRRIHDAKGKFADTEYLLYETAQEAQKAEEAEGKKKAKPSPLSPASEQPALEKPMQENPTSEKPMSDNPPLEKAQGFAPIADFPTLDKPTSGKPTSGNPLQQSKQLQNTYHTTTAASPDALPKELTDAAKRCRVSGQTVKIAAARFGAEKVKRYLAFLGVQKNIKNPNGWLMRALAEEWEICDASAAHARPDCPECGGEGFTLRYYEDPLTGENRPIKVNCAKCRRGQ